MCTGACLLYKIARVVIGENKTFLGSEELLQANGVQVKVLNDESCKQIMQEYIKAHATQWNEDIGEMDV